MELELKHLAPYLSYGLKMQYFDEERGSMTICDIVELRLEEMTISDKNNQYEVLFYETRPILRQMSDLDTNDDAWCSHKEEIKNAIEFDTVTEDIPYYWVQLMLANHFDVFGLIPAGLAIDINTLPA